MITERASQLKTLTGTSGPTKNPSGVITPGTAIPARATRDLRDDIYEAYDPAPGEVNSVKKILGIDS